MKRSDDLDPRSGIYEITPEDAQKLLASPGAKNRPLKKTTVVRYSRRMEGGLWRLSGEPILLSKDGALLDGEHRLRACIESGVSFTTVVLWGDFQFLEMGQGRSRSGGDAIALGVSDAINTVALSAVAGLCIRHDRALAKERSVYTGIATGEHALFDIDNKERVAWIRKNRRVMELYSQAIHLGAGAGLIPGAAATAAWYLAERATSPKTATDFFEGLLTGAGLAPSDVRLLLRRALSSRLLNGKRLIGIEVLHWLAKAWSERKSSGRRVFTVKRDEPFPFIR